MKIDNNLLLHTVPMTLIRSRSLSSSALGILITNKHFTLIPPTYSAQNAYTQKVKVCIVISSQVNIGDALSKSHLFKKSATVGQIPMSINQHPKTSSKLWDPWHSTVVIMVINVVVFFTSLRLCVRCNDRRCQGTLMLSRCLRLEHFKGLWSKKHFIESFF